MDEYIYVQEWQQKTELTFWGTEEEKDPYCNMINGSDGTQYPPDRLDENSVVYIFVTQLCRLDANVMGCKSHFKILVHVRRFVKNPPRVGCIPTSTGHFRRQRAGT